MSEFDDIFKDLWNDEPFKKLMAQRRRMEQSFKEHIRRLQEAIKSEKLQGRAEITPIERPGIKGYIFHGVFGIPGTLEGVGETPELNSETEGRKGDFKLLETAKQSHREPVVETFRSDDEFIAVVELPGVEEHDIKVVSRNESIQVDALNFKAIEIDVPSDANTDKMTKTLKNGVLEIRIPLMSDKVRDPEPKFGVV